MANPHLFLASRVTRRLDDLEGTLCEIRNDLTRMRRRVAFASVRSGVGTFEAPLTPDGSRFNVHVHLVLDTEDPLLAISKEWRRVSRGSGQFTRDPIHPRVVNAHRLAGYMAKSDSLSPVDIEAEALRRLAKGVRGKQLVVKWPRSLEATWDDLA